ncbi:hypothetical protein PROFUN_02505 [Planoprotostelium fungivorum]|uniref:Uncharacterized protein n=1 Tax=Planoprotostelium fungivorum TaxID=1890364 RepID=A0A2P6MP96_9EUKA|nr:hypothetical protein PROFUN_02505 [Planoprotostelium fungivorum]
MVRFATEAEIYEPEYLTAEDISEYYDSDEEYYEEDMPEDDEEELDEEPPPSVPVSQPPPKSEEDASAQPSGRRGLKKNDTITMLETKRSQDEAAARHTSNGEAEKSGAEANASPTVPSAVTSSDELDDLIVSPPTGSPQKLASPKPRALPELEARHTSNGEAEKSGAEANASSTVPSAVTSSDELDDLIVSPPTGSPQKLASPKPRALPELEERTGDLRRAVARLRGVTGSSEAQKISSMFGSEDREWSEPSANEAVPPLIELIRKQTSNPDIVLSGLSIIRLMKDTNGIKHLFRDHEGMQLLGNCSRSKNELIRRMSLRFAGELFTKNSAIHNVRNVEAAAKSELLQGIIQCLTEECEENQSLAVGLIRIIASFEGKSSVVQFKREITLYGGIPAILELMGKERPDLVKSAAQCIQRFGETNDQRKPSERANAVRVGSKDTVESDSQRTAEALLTAITKWNETDSGVTLRLIDALRVVTAYNGPSLGYLISDGMTTILSVLQSSHPEEVYEPCYSMLASAATLDKNAGVKMYECGLLDTFLNCKSPSEDTLRAALTALAANIQGNAAALHHTLSTGGIVKMCDVLSSARSDGLVGAALTVVRVLMAESLEAQEAFTEIYFTGPQTTTSQQKFCGYLNNPHVETREAVLDILRILRNIPTVTQIISQAFSSIVALLISPSPHIRESAVTCVEASIRTDVGMAAATRDTRLVNNIAPLLDINAPKEKMIVRVCSSIDLLAADARLKDQIVNKSSVPLRLTNLLSSPSSEIRENCVYSIWNLSSNCEKAQTAFGKLKIVRKLCDLINSSEASALLKELCAGAINALLMDHPANQKTVGTKEVECILSLMEEQQTAKLQTYAAKCVFAACDENARNQELFYNSSSALSRLVALLSHPEHFTSASAVSAVWSLSAKNVKTQNAFRLAGVVPPIYDLLIIHTNDYVNLEGTPQTDARNYLRVTLGAIAALSNKNNFNRDAFVQVGALTTVEKLKDTTDKQIVKEVSAALQALGSAKVKSKSVFDFATNFLREKSQGPNSHRGTLDETKKKNPVSKLLAFNKSEKTDKEREDKEKEKMKKKAEKEEKKEEKKKEDKKKEKPKVRQNASFDQAAVARTRSSLAPEKTEREEAREERTSLEIESDAS